MNPESRFVVSPYAFWRFCEILWFLVRGCYCMPFLERPCKKAISHGWFLITNLHFTERGHFNKRILYQGFLLIKDVERVWRFLSYFTCTRFLWSPHSIWYLFWVLGLWCLMDMTSAFSDGRPSTLIERKPFKYCTKKIRMRKKTAPPDYMDTNSKTHLHTEKKKKKKKKKEKIFINHGWVCDYHLHL